MHKREAPSLKVRRLQICIAYRMADMRVALFARERTCCTVYVIIIIITRQMLSIVASGSDATVVNGFLHSALEVVRELS